MVQKQISIKEDISKYASCFELNNDQLKFVMKTFEDDLLKGLKTDSSQLTDSTLKMLPTYLHDVPNLSKPGIYYALDLGGTNLRFVSLSNKNGKFETKATQIAIPEEIMRGTADELFNFLASFLKEGLEKIGMASTHIPYIGFTFSFPVDQTSLFSGNLITWTKGFDVKGVEGQDVASLLLKATTRLGLSIGHFVLVNDTTGTLLSGVSFSNDSVIGVINGTGTNACYIEDIKNVPKWDGPVVYPYQLLINTEWGALGDLGGLDSIRNKYDITLDENSLRPRKHVYEKMISGMYLGELARLVIKDMVSDKFIFDGKMPESLEKPNSLETRFLSQAYDAREMASDLIKYLGIQVNTRECDILSSLFDQIVFRSAQLLASTITVLVKRQNRQTTVISIDGSMFTKNPFYTKYVNRIMKSLDSPHFNLVPVDDGSGKGAALASAVIKAKEEREENLKKYYE